MKTYSISIHPKANIVYCYVSIGETANHALANLSFEIRNCLRLLNNDNSDYNKLLEVLKVIRKYWRYTLGSFNKEKWIKVSCVSIKAMQVSYDIPLTPIIVSYDNEYRLTYTSNHYKFYEKIPSRNKPNKIGARPGN